MSNQKFLQATPASKKSKPYSDHAINILNQFHLSQELTLNDLSAHPKIKKLANQNDEIANLIRYTFICWPIDNFKEHLSAFRRLITLLDHYKTCFAHLNDISTILNCINKFVKNNELTEFPLLLNEVLTYFIIRLASMQQLNSREIITIINNLTFFNEKRLLPFSDEIKTAIANFLVKLPTIDALELRHLV